MGISERDEEAAASSTPQDDSGDGPVTIEDRVEPGGEGSPGANQSKTEPMSPTGTHAEPLAVPDLSDMNVGAGDPQAPRHPAAVGSDASADSGRAPAVDSTAPHGEGDDASVPVPGDTPSPGTSEEHRHVSRIKLPEADEA